MLELPDKIGYAIWDDKDFTIPKEFKLNENSKLNKRMSLIEQGVPEIFTKDF